ncbi:phospholipase A2 family protein [Tepidibacter mesophilus]|uniref:phospholipase A2 family protein n=1 Tax=Tepidibacter mesophilus TaxID=655607 RepID=UPI000C084B85|nr:phospholipase A2 family protein [Tepidibacter mesophilus]
MEKNLEQTVKEKEILSDEVEVNSGLPVYGNWCGPGHGGGTPIDKVDEACMVHDKCYGKEGYFNCDCDKALTTEIRRLIKNGDVQSLKAKAVVTAMLAWFENVPCRS